MYNRFLWVMVCSFFAFPGRAQLSISLHELPGGIVQKNQLWNIALIYSSNTPVSVTIGLSLTDVNTSQVVMTAFTRPIFISKGVRQLKVQDIAPIDYNYFSPAFNISNLPDAFIPIGGYRACFTFYNSKSNEQVLAEDCMVFEVQPLSPPLLNTPSDSAALETTYPQFTWLPPSPITLFTNLNYDLLVTEIQAGQTPETAIQENLPVYTALHLTSMVNNYPASYKSLDTGKFYAWRIVAKNYETVAAQSEVWTFHVKSRDTVHAEFASKTFFELTRNNGLVTTGLVTDGVLRIKYYSYDKSREAVIKIIDGKGTLVKELKKTVQYGNNFFEFPLDRSFKEDTTYFIELDDVQLSHYKTSFRIAK